MNDTLIFLPISTIVNEQKSNLSNIKRKEQYINGIKNLLKYKNINKFDILLIDNTTIFIDNDINNLLPDNSIFISINKNKNGSINPGAGIIECWLNCQNILKNYKWILHFEPRLNIINYNFFDLFLNDKQSIFKYGSIDKNHFFTGIFTIQTDILINFINTIDINYMCNNHIGLEYNLFDFYKSNNIQFIETKLLNIIWHDRMINKYINN
jgi:hypothetical protein